MDDNIPMAGKKLQWIEGTTARWDGYMEFQRRPDPLTLEQQYRRLTQPLGTRLRGNAAVQKTGVFRKTAAFALTAR